MKEGSLLALTRHWYLGKARGRADNAPRRNVRGNSRSYKGLKKTFADLLKYMEDLAVGAHFPSLIQTSGRKISPGHESQCRSPAAGGSRALSLDRTAASSPCPKKATSAQNRKPTSLQRPVLHRKLPKRQKHPHRRGETALK